jgi:hypothetical protein
MSKMMAKFDRDFWLLRKFCNLHGVSRGLQARMKRYIEFVVVPAEHKLCMGDCILIHKLSPNLRAQLHAEISAHVLHHHPFFHYLNKGNKSVMTRVCFVSLEETPMALGDVAFVGGEKGRSMFVVTFGYLEYIPVVDPEKEVTVGTNEWSSEAVFWTKWVHQGQLQTSVESKCITVDAKKFRKALVENALVLDFARDYGVAFCNALNSHLRERGMPSDLQSQFTEDYFAARNGSRHKKKEK